MKKWFDDLWEEAAPYDLSSLYEERYVEYDPYLIYLRVLWERYGAELEEERIETRIRLTTFQNDGIWRAKRILDDYNGVVIADGVGLGKTFIGGELLREVVEVRRQRALLVSPATLRDGTWRRFADHHSMYIENVSFEELASDLQLGGERSYLKHRIGDYSLIVIDEAQAFRNPDTRRAQVLRQLLRGTPPKKLVFLTATPVNNSLWDLYYLLTYFVGHDARFADKGIPSLKQRFAQANAEDPFDLRPDALFDILDAVTVRRTRHFVRRYYPHDRITGPDGIETTIKFPDPHVERVDYKLDEVLPNFFEEFAEALAPEHGDPELTLARYMPSRYIKGEPDIEDRELALVGLLRSGLLKRFESSIYAFARTTGKMAAAHDAFIEALDQGYILSPEAIEEWLETDTDEGFEELLRTGDTVSAERYDYDRLKSDLQNDRDLLSHFAKTAETVTQDKDPKLASLVEELAEIAKKAEKEGMDDEDIRDKRKVLIFSYFADTVDWIEEHLLEVVEKDPRLACYQGRIASVSGQDSRRGISRERAIFGFAPRTTEAPPGLDEDCFDILICTDVLAEGMNFQQCRNIINFDLPWNPMRLVQRNGRIDRIGSLHADVYIRCFFPDEHLNELLDLERRVRRKLAQAAASIGVESEVIPEGATSEVVFSETKKEIETLRKEEADLFVNAGEDPSAHSGEEYRQELRKGLETREEEIKSLPWAVGSGFAGGAKKGHFFCARVGDRLFFRFVPSDGDEIVTDTLGCLSLITCTGDTERHVAPDLLESVYDAWEQARRDIYEEWMFATDPANLQPRVPRLFRSVAEHLRKYPPKDQNQADLHKVLDAIEAPWADRIVKQFRAVFDPESTDPYEVSKAIVEKVRELGLEPFIAPEPLPVIDEDEIMLICWMAVDSEISD